VAFGTFILTGIASTSLKFKGVFVACGTFVLTGVSTTKLNSVRTFRLAVGAFVLLGQAISDGITFLVGFGAYGLNSLTTIVVSSIQNVWGPLGSFVLGGMEIAGSAVQPAGTFIVATPTVVQNATILSHNTTISYVKTRLIQPVLTRLRKLAPLLRD